jgi:hypothetical protein
MRPMFAEIRKDRKTTTTISLQEDFESESFLKIINKEIDKLESSLLRTEKMLNIYQTVEEKKHLLVNDYKF